MAFLGRPGADEAIRIGQRLSTELSLDLIAYLDGACAARSAPPSYVAEFVRILPLNSRQRSDFSRSQLL